jgi:iron complex outermembrane receptor protein
MHHAIRAIAAGAALLIGYAFATPAQSAEAGSNGIEEVVVTARKVKEQAQTVPIAITAFTGAQLTRNSVKTLADIQGTVPNLFLQPSAIDPEGITIAIRGQLQNDLILTVDPSIGIYVDGLYYPRTQGMNGALVDIDQLEVLRGPQGTLFGRNTTGGALNIHTNDPTDDLGGSFSLQGGEKGTWQTTGIINVPFGRDLDGRFVVLRGGNGAYGSDEAGAPLGKENRTYVRGKLKARVGDNIEVILSGTYQNNTDSGSVLTQQGLAPASSCPAYGVPGCLATLEAAAELFGFGGLTNPADLAAASAKLASYSNLPHYRSGSTYPESGAFKAYAGGLDIKVDLPHDLTFRSITGYESYKRYDTTDDDGTPFDILAVIFSTREKYYSQEFQLLGKTGSLNWVAGAYGSYEDGSEYSVAPAFGLLNPASPGITDGDIINRSVAAFAQANWEFVPMWRLTAGIRYSEDRRQLTSNNSNALGCTVPAGIITGVPGDPLNGPAQCPRSFADNFGSPSWLVSLDHKFSDTVLAYAKVAYGYRSGGENLRGSTDIASFAPFQPEKVTEYEAGVKSEWFDRQVRLNLAAYHDNYTNIQRSVTVIAPTNDVISLVQNAAKAHIDGFELESEWLLTPQLTVSGSTGLTAAKYTEYKDALADHSGQPFPVPRWTANLSARYAVPTSFGQISGKVGYSWQSRVDLSPEFPDSPSDYQGSYGLLDARISAQITAWNTELFLYGSNLGGEYYKTSAFGVDGAVGYNMVAWGNPRIIGGGFTVRFGAF